MSLMNSTAYWTPAEVWSKFCKVGHPRCIWSQCPDSRPVFYTFLTTSTQISTAKDQSTCTSRSLCFSIHYDATVHGKCPSLISTPKINPTFVWIKVHLPFSSPFHQHINMALKLSIWSLLIVLSSANLLVSPPRAKSFLYKHWGPRHQLLWGSTNHRHQIAKITI